MVRMAQAFNSRLINEQEREKEKAQTEQAEIKRVVPPLPNGE